MAVTKSPLRSCRAVIPDGEGKVQYERNPASESIAAMAEATGSDPMALIYDALVSEKVLWAPLGRNPNQVIHNVAQQSRTRPFVDTPHA